jgi:hypothetical protein
MALRLTGRSPTFETVMVCDVGVAVPPCSIVKAAVVGLREMMPGAENRAVTVRLWFIATTQVELVVQVNPLPVPVQYSQLKSGFDEDATSVTLVPRGYVSVHGALMYEQFTAGVTPCELTAPSPSTATVSITSLSVTVTVCVAGVPNVAFVGVPKVTITVSLGSATVSFTTVTVAVPAVLPAAIVTGLALIV